MIIYRTLEEIKKHPHPIVVLGNFDGVHAGHRKILEVVVALSKNDSHSESKTSIACTYSPNTKVFFRKITEERLLDTEEQKLEKLSALGIDACIVLPFTADFATMTAEAFVRDILIGKIGMKELVMGYDTNFGSDKKGDYEHLLPLSVKYDFAITIVDPLMEEGEIISSTLIRKNR